MSESPAIKARMAKLALDERRRQKHLPIAIALRDPLQAVGILDSAWDQIRLWREKQLCSACYIEAWERLLTDPPQLAEVLESKAPWAVQLRQNSPFVAVIRRLSERNA